ncbi:MAG: methylated-DNA--[protein]-cysteine S-methyltransferase [Terriglobales bacterium]
MRRRGQLFHIRDRAILQRVMEKLFYHRAPSPAGPLFLAASTKGLVRLEFEARVQKLNLSAIELQESKSILAPYLGELDEYFVGQRREFSLPLDLRGTDFQLACWRALLEIPYGETRSYRDIAQAIGHPRAYRAVGMSNNRNPVAIVVPCHRVIASSGSLCGYGGGLDLKRKLLDLEREHVQQSDDRPSDARLPKTRASRIRQSIRQSNDQPCLPLRIGA